MITSFIIHNTSPPWGPVFMGAVPGPGPTTPVVSKAHTAATAPIPAALMSPGARSRLISIEHTAAKLMQHSSKARQEGES
jgi:hypothetical protein